MEEIMRQTFFKEQYEFEDLIRIVRQLRAPDGCPWDRVQTHESMHDCMIEEAFEVVEAVNNKDIPNLREELGDVLLQVIMHSVIAEENNEFSFGEVVDELSKKLVRRHPHVFGGEESADTPAEGLNRWEAIKATEKKSMVGELSRIPHELPPQMRAKKVIKKSEKIYGNSKGAEAIEKALVEYEVARNQLTVAIDAFIKDKEV